ncbi:low molecular weight phosphotyrosine protein phosphatase [Robbsia sp. Bb-Pol-6]|uniref:protein-tyrosine-phosphatase n=1 Tax=Robbsia betulipollinis TaxID=2981849 RepID=A0ABT3ZV57_9BURK|nr:low molecular weight protein-tyrosine-phosphatase [Robbsia betulipollinis]MCY0389780.1 low molecular weight phosphotyrosine protein phosphatase [Robbsia betulipollinis]
MFKNVLIVCHANICRSPMAEALLVAQPAVKEAGIFVHSAGLAGADGNKADKVVSDMLARRGIDLSAHRSRRLTIDMIRAAQLVLVMEQHQIRGVETMDSSSKGKVHLLGKWDDVEIADPYRQSESVYQGSAELVERSVANWIKKIC